MGSLPIWIVATQWISRLILILLVGLSVWSVATMIRCSRVIKNAEGAPGKFEGDLTQIAQWIVKSQWELFRDWAKKENTLHAGTALKILDASALGSAQIDRAVKSYLSLQRTQLEQGLTVLATLGSNAPFIGLFGTVLGIIQAFGALGASQNTTEIMVGISEALFATAVGLFVAIPAVVAFNIFSRRLRVLMVNAEALRDFYLSQMKAS